MSSEPATKQDLADAVQQVTDKLTEAIRDSQTEVLRAFYDELVLSISGSGMPTN